MLASQGAGQSQIHGYNGCNLPVDARMQLLVAMNLADDLDAIASERLIRLGYRGDGRDRPFDRFATLYTYTERVIPQVPYAVRYSAELSRNPKFKTHRKEVRTYFESATLFRPRRTPRPRAQYTLR